MAKKSEILKIDSYDIPDSFIGLENRKKIKLLKNMHQIRAFELKTEQFIIRGKIHGACHLYIGEEACATGAIFALGKDDYLTSTHRGHGHCIAKGADLNLMMAELLGKSTGYCKGKGGSMHIADVETGNLGANGIVGGSIGIATGAGLTCKLKKNGKIALCFFGDGAINRGIFHGSVNMASVWDLPVIYLCENNVYGMSTPVKASLNIEKMSDRKIAYGIDGLTIDGNDVIEIFNTVSHFRLECIKGRGPILIEAKTYRWKGHSKSDAQVYRTKKEVKEWMTNDPIKRYAGTLVADKIITKKDADDIEKEAFADVEKAAEFAVNSPFPDTSTVEEDVYA